MPRLEHGMARVEFLAIRQDAEALMEQGYQCTKVFRHLREAGKISMCYQAFRGFIRASKPKPTKAKKTRPAVQMAELPAIVQDTPSQPEQIVQMYNDKPQEGPIVVDVSAETPPFGSQQSDLSDLL